MKSIIYKINIKNLLSIFIITLSFTQVESQEKTYLHLM